jgi:hypothetical protein
MSDTPSKLVRLSDKEQSALLDRLNIPSAIAEALTDAPEGEQPTVPDNYDTVLARVEVLATLIGTTDRAVPPLFTDLDKAIVIDAVEGSVYAACCSSDPALFRARLRTLYGLARKLLHAGIADRVSVPTA